MSKVARFQRVTARWYKLEETQRPIGVFSMDTVPIVPLLRGDQAFKVWPKPKRGFSAYPRKRKAPGGDPAGEEDIADEVPALELLDAEAELELDELLHSEEAGDAGLDLFVESQGSLLVDHAVVLRDAEAEPAADSAATQRRPQPPAPERPRRPRGKAVATAEWEFGKLQFYASNNGSFQATCKNPAHGKCVLTRSARAVARASNDLIVRGGRPCGFLLAWLQSAGVAAKEEHWAPANLETSLDARLAARLELEETPEGREFLSHERPQVGDEPAEPETLQGLLG